MELSEKRKLRVPPAVVTNLVYLNILIILTLLFSTLGLHYFLRPKGQPVTFSANEGGKTKDIGIMAWWEMDIALARCLLDEGIPFLKRRNNP